MIAAIIIFICIAIGVFYLDYTNRRHFEKISFKESLDLTDLPIVTFYNNGRKLHFLLDTGANKSIINERELATCDYSKLENKNQLTGLDGISRKVENVAIVISYRDRSFTEHFQVTDMSPVFDEIKKATGVSVHGLLGNAFFRKYRYILDFNELVAYSKSNK